MSKKTVMVVLTALFPKNFDRESIGTVTRLVATLNRLRDGDWHGRKTAFLRMSLNHRGHLVKMAVSNGYMRTVPDPADRRRRLYCITKKGLRLLDRLEALTNVTARGKKK